MCGLVNRGILCIFVLLSGNKIGNSGKLSCIFSTKFLIIRNINQKNIFFAQIQETQIVKLVQKIGKAVT